MLGCCFFLAGKKISFTPGRPSSLDQACSECWGPGMGVLGIVRASARMRVCQSEGKSECSVAAFGTLEPHPNAHLHRPCRLHWPTPSRGLRSSFFPASEPIQRCVVVLSPISFFSLFFLPSSLLDSPTRSFLFLFLQVPLGLVTFSSFLILQSLNIEGACKPHLPGARLLCLLWPHTLTLLVLGGFFSCHISCQPVSRCQRQSFRRFRSPPLWSDPSFLVLHMVASLLVPDTDT